MYRLGLDIGSSTIKAVLMRDDVIEQAEIVHHYGDLLNGLVEIFTKIKFNDVCKMYVTGSNSRIMRICCRTNIFSAIYLPLRRVQNSYVLRQNPL